MNEKFVAIHNLRSSEMLKTLDLGGFPAPSIAVTKLGFDHTKYGDVSVIFKESTVDPKRSGNYLYSGDAWTPEFPSIEYKVSNKRINEIYNHLSPYFEDFRVREHFSFNVHLHHDNVEQNLNSSGGDILIAFSNKDFVKYAFVKDTGVDIELAMKKEKLHTIIPNEVMIAAADKISLEELNEILETKDPDRLEELVDKIKPTIKDFYKERLENAPENARRFVINKMERDYENCLDFSTNDNRRVAETLVELLAYYKEYGVKDVPDYKTFDDKINEYVENNQEAFEKWTCSLFDNIIEKAGLRNDKDIFTSSGNRRSWDALHDDLTLGNIVKHMKQQEKTAVGMGTTGQLEGWAAKSFKSISDMLKDSDRLTGIDDETFEELRDKYKKDFEDAVMSYPGDKGRYFSIMDSALEAMKYDTPESVVKYMKRDGFDNFPLETAKKMLAAREGLSNMPTMYFEAKPLRAVDFNEIAAIVVPENSDELIDALIEAGLEDISYTYDGTDKDRMMLINELGDKNYIAEKETSLDNLIGKASVVFTTQVKSDKVVDNDLEK